jgi:cell division protein FtsB
MKQESNKRLYFTDDFSPENVKKLQDEGYILRKASAYHEGDTLEPCLEVAGDAPKAYLDLIAKNNAKIITTNVKVGISPELQKVIDDTKAECVKVKTENDDLKQQIETLKAGLKQGEPADLSGLIPTEQFDVVAQKLTETEEQLVTAQDEFIKFKNDVEAMKARIAELQGDDTSVGTTSEAVDYNALTADQLRALLDEKEIKYLARDNKDTLIALLTQPTKTEE